MSIDTLLSGNMHVIALAGDVSSQIRPSMAKVPTENPEPKGNQGHILAHVRTHTRTREIYPRDVGSEAQFFRQSERGRISPWSPLPRWPMGPSEPNSQWGVGALVALWASPGHMDEI